MTLDEIKIVQASFNRVFTARKALGTAFYDRLFETAPRVQDMFPSDMQNMHLKIVDMLDYVVLHLNKPQILEESVAELAKRHKEYGVLPGHFSAVGTALMQAISAQTPGGLTQPEVEAWTSVYTFISEIMIEEMQPNTA